MGQQNSGMRFSALGLMPSTHLQRPMRTPGKEWRETPTTYKFNTEKQIVGESLKEGNFLIYVGPGKSFYLLNYLTFYTCYQSKCQQDHIEFSCKGT